MRLIQITHIQEECSGSLSVSYSTEVERLLAQKIEKKIEMQFPKLKFDPTKEKGEMRTSLHCIK